MAANKNRTSKRHKDVQNAFIKLRDKKTYRYDWIITKLSNDYHYQEKTIENIVSKIGKEEEGDKNQPKLF